jgi:hypothetical protein
MPFEPDADFDPAPSPRPRKGPRPNGKIHEPPIGDYDGPDGHQGRLPPDDLDSFKALGVVWADDIQLELDKPGLVDGLLGTTAMTVLYGESGSGKTFVAVDLASHVAAGKPWRGMDVEQGVVIYVAAESPTSIERRIWAWKRRHDVEHLPIAIVTASVNLLNGDTEKIIALIRRIREQTGRPVAFVVIDTLARAMVGNENSPEDMGAFVSSCDRIREATAGHVMVVHHSGKDQARGARGHSSLRAATDVEMEVIGGESVRSVTVKKNRDGEEGATYGFKLDTVELGENAKGRMVTTCVVAEREADGEVTKVTNAACRGANQRVTYEALQAALCDHGAPPPPARDIPPNVRVVTVVQWREAAVRYLPHEETKHKAQAFKRAMERLVAERAVRHVDGYVWLPGPDGHKGHISPDVTECDRTESPGHKGHTVTHPFRGVTDVTVTSDGQEQPIGGSKDGLESAPGEQPVEATAEAPTRSILVSDKKGLPATIVQANVAGIPVLSRVKLTLLAVDRFADGLFYVKAEWCEMNGQQGRRMYRPGLVRSFDTDLVLIVEGDDLDVSLNRLGVRHSLSDHAPKIPVWQDIAKQVRESGRNILVDTIDRALPCDGGGSP